MPYEDQLPATWLTPPRVLVVDDDGLSRDLQTRMLALLGFEGVATDDGAVALELACSRKVDAVLLDLGMPETDGFCLLRALREHEARENRRPLPVIAVTGYSAEADRLRCLVAGFQDHLPKPVDSTALAALLRRLLADERAVPDESDAQRVLATAQRLARIKPGDATFAPNMLETFAMRSGQLVEDAIAHTQARDMQKLAQTAAALTTSAEFMGARHLADAAAALSRAADNGDWPAAAHAVAQLPAVHEAVLTILLGTHRRMARPDAQAAVPFLT